MDYTKITFISKENDESKKSKWDTKTENLFLALEKIKEKNKHQNFKNWLNTDITDTISYDNEDENKHYLIRHMLEDLISEVNEKLNNYGYEIKQQKPFRDEVASFIYKLSRE